MLQRLNLCVALFLARAQRAGICIALALASLCSGAASAQQFAWKSTMPVSRDSHSMAFDSARGTTVIFGGWGEDGYHRNDTWEWDGDGWSEKITNGNAPSPRTAHRMVYDSQRGVVVLFGGIINNGYALANDTWEWDGHVWTQRPVAGPSPRYAHVMAYDSDRHLTVLMGGNTGDYVGVNDVWEWNGTVWTLRGAAPALLRRYSHSLAYDSTRHKCVVFGGLSGNGSAGTAYFNDTWEWDGNTWSARIPLTVRPAARCALQMVFDAQRNRIVISGGHNGVAFFGDTWDWDGTRWTQSTGMEPRAYHAMVFDSQRGVTLSYGGWQTRLIRGELAQFNGSSWSIVSGRPSSDNTAALVVDSGRGKVVMFGGFGGYSVGVTDKTWEWDGRVWKLLSITGPSPRMNHSMAYDSARQRTIMFGGVDSSDTWSFDGLAWTRVSDSGPPPRRSAAMAFDSIRQRVVLFGGYLTSGAGYAADTWEWDGATWTQKIGTGPTARSGHFLYFDQVRGLIVMMGGHGTSPVAGEVWTWDGNVWHLDRVDALYDLSAIAVNTTTGNIVANGTLQQTVGTYVWTGQAWESLVAGNYGYTGRNFMIYDSVHHTTMRLWGTGWNDSFGDTYTLESECGFPSTVVQPQDIAVCGDRVAQFQLEVTSAEPCQYQWSHMRPYGYLWEILADGPGSIGVITGASTPHLRIDDFNSSSIGTYRCIVSSSCGSISSTVTRAVFCPADFNCDTSVDFADYLDFLNAFSGSALESDFNHDGAIDMFDYLDFLMALRRGCEG